MSAYLTNPTKIGILAQAIAAQTHEHGDAAAIAQELAAENLRSVGHRYGEDANGTAQKFMGISAAQYVKLCSDAARDPANAPDGMSHAALLDLVGEYRYQSCECDDWPQTKAAGMLQVLTDAQASIQPEADGIAGI